MSSAPPPAPPGPPPSAPPPGWSPGPPPGGRRTPWGWIVAGVVIVLVLVVGAVLAVVLLNGDDEATADDSPSTPASSAASSAATSPTAAPVSASALAGHWRGTYTCAQGDTGLSLDVIATSDSQLTAIFHFRKIPENPDVPEGSYKMTGTLEDGKLRLRRLAWIDRPQGYVMVGLNAKVTDAQPDELTGTVSNVGCQEFTITRQ